MKGRVAVYWVTSQRLAGSGSGTVNALEDALATLAIEKGNVTTAIFLLKGARPEKYKERQQIQHELDPSKLS